MREFVFSFLNEVVAFIQRTDPNFTCGVKLDYSTRRTRSRAGMYKEGPAINIAGESIKYIKATKRFIEYSSFENVPEIGTFIYSDQDDPFLGVKALICHEVGHAFMAYKNSSNTAHGKEWKAVYKYLRNEFVNPYINKELNKFKEIKIEDIKLEKINISTKDDTFHSHCRNYGMRPDHLGKSFKIKNNKYIIIGINPRARKYPVEARKEGTNSNYRFTVTTVLENIIYDI